MSYVVEHGRGFRYKRKVPLALQDLIGKRAWKVWLGGNKIGKARQRLALKIAVETQ